MKNNAKKSTSVVDTKKILPKDRLKQIIKRKPSNKFLNAKQEQYWDAMDKNEITICLGPSGCGKSHLSMKKAVDLLYDDTNKYEKILIVRPAVEAEEKLGSLPGGLQEKLDPYVFPTFYLLSKIVGKDGKEMLVKEEFVEIMALAYMRGWNVDNTIVIAEEFQNATPSQMKLLLTRIGSNSKFFISGDIEQSDKFKDKTKSGLYDAKTRLKGMKNIGVFEFDEDDIVRNPIVKEILNRYD